MFRAKTKSYMGNSLFMDFTRHLAHLWRKKKSDMYFGTLFRSYGININFIRKISNLASLVTSIVFNDNMSEKLPPLGLLMKYEKWGEYGLKTVRVEPNKCKLYYFEPACISLGLMSLLFLSKCFQGIY